MPEAQVPDHELAAVRDGELGRSRQTHQPLAVRRVDLAAHDLDMPVVADFGEVALRRVQLAGRQLQMSLRVAEGGAVARDVQYFDKAVSAHLLAARRKAEHAVRHLQAGAHVHPSEVVRDSLARTDDHRAGPVAAHLEQVVRRVVEARARLGLDLAADDEPSLRAGVERLAALDENHAVGVDVHRAALAEERVAAHDPDVGRRRGGQRAEGRVAKAAIQREDAASLQPRAAVVGGILRAPVEHRAAADMQAAVRLAFADAAHERGIHEVVL